jgi:preprotein translocase subunit SecE
MARPTRQQRRARRVGRDQATSSEQARASRQDRSLQYEKLQPGRKPERTGGRFGFVRFIGESAGELKKVDWPNRPQVIQGTVVVILACAIVGGYLFVADLAIKRFVETILLGQ